MPNSISEWFGHRLFPTVTSSPAAVDDQRQQRCPFLSDALHGRRKCTKAQNSKGVCTVSSESDGIQMDWVVCPYRTLTSPILPEAARHLFQARRAAELVLFPAPTLSEPATQERIRNALSSGAHALVYFMDKLGGEIDIPGGRKSPKFKLDTTLVEIVTTAGKLNIGRHAILEVQTMDFHGSYRAATDSLANALKLHPKDFPKQFEQNPNWASAGIQSPNIANVFKRTIYQTLFKFQLGAHQDCAGSALAIQESVWRSWQPHLGAPDLTPLSDGTFRLATPPASSSDTDGKGWIFVFEVERTRKRTPNPIRVTRVIRAGAGSLTDLAFRKAPHEAMALLTSSDSLRAIIRRRIRQFWPDFLA
jgi:hypothetical protein